MHSATDRLSDLARACETHVRATFAGPVALRPVSLTFDVGPVGDSAEAKVDTQVVRSTRTLVFARARLFAPEGVVLALSAVYAIGGASG
jgi:hypothetical protein